MRYETESYPSRLPAIDNRFEVITELGRGGTAYVYQVRDKNTGLQYAMKTIKHDGNMDDLAKERVLKREHSAMEQL